MTGRSRHGLHVVTEGAATTPEPPESDLSLHLSSVVLAVAGRLTTTTAGHLRMSLSMFTVDGGPRKLVLDLSDVSAVDGDGLTPIFEAEEVLSLRGASLRLVSVPPAVAGFLDDARRDRPLVEGDRPPVPPGGRRARRTEDDPRRGRD
jgi:anti-anti-sigma factor